MDVTVTQQFMSCWTKIEVSLCTVVETVLSTTLENTSFNTPIRTQITVTEVIRVISNSSSVENHRLHKGWLSDLNNCERVDDNLR